MVLLEAGVELPFGFPDVGGGTVVACNLVHHSGLLQSVKLVLGVNQSPSDGVEGLDVGSDSSFPDVSG